MEDKAICLLFLGIVAVIAIVGLIMMFSEMGKSGAFTVSMPKTQCPSGSTAYAYTTAYSLMQNGAAKCKQVGINWCCTKIPITRMTGIKIPPASFPGINT